MGYLVITVLKFYLLLFGINRIEISGLVFVTNLI